MRIDEGMGYQERDRKRGRVQPVQVVMIVGLVVTVAVAVMLIASGSPSTPAVQPTPTPTPTRGTVEPSASGSATPVAGEDAVHGEGAAARSWAVASRFVEGWQEPEKQHRGMVLAETASPELASQLSQTAPENVSTAALVSLVLEGSSDQATEFTATFADGLTVTVMLTADPAGPSGWTVTSVEQVG